MRYKEVLKKYGMTQSELAERMGIAHKQTLNKMLSPSYNMGIEKIQQIAKIVGCPTGELFDDWKETAELKTVANAVCPHCGKGLAIHITAEE